MGWNCFIRDENWQNKNGEPAIIDPAIQKHNELRLIKAREPKIRKAEDFSDVIGIENQ
jgi:hypothetical protein